ncbi:pilus assembly protein [Croceicoccus ponticola]|uniref:Pilus assembly protein n=1 Tax=Croceicoccus ponticola TaxID=2217664 RepID=A0A437H1J4_9SPHN|nr:TadE/TadG family type IV pilus assembly protein [Croceicoccus ponticola]RVQ69392.1 pilus assembly protein [Croceicoccus ponticola]
MKRLFRNTAAASAAEFALILPAALLILFGVIDVGRYAWQLNQYEKAVQLGVRYAVASEIVASPINTMDFSSIVCPGSMGALQYGDPICAEAMKTVVCNSTACTCPNTSEPGQCGAAAGATFNSAAFNRIVSRMRVASKRIGPGDVEITYAGSGLGYYGDPAIKSSCSPGDSTAPCQLPDAAPIVSVRLTNMRYQPITLSLLGVDVPYPRFSYSLTMEDGDGAVAS